MKLYLFQNNKQEKKLHFQQTQFKGKSGKNRMILEFSGKKQNLLPSPQNDLSPEICAMQDTQNSSKRHNA